MTQSERLKLILSYDRTRNEYSLVAHNQSAEAADAHVAQYTPHLRDGCSFIVLVQGRPHRTAAAHACRACRETVARSTHLQPQPKLIKEA